MLCKTQRIYKNFDEGISMIILDGAPCRVAFNKCLRIGLQRFEM